MSRREDGHYHWCTVDADETPTRESDDHIVLTTAAEAFAELADLNDPPVGEGPSEGSRGAPAPRQERAFVGEVAPPVVAVVVVHNAEDSFDETLRSLGEQTYENLSVLIIDADSDIDPTPRIAQVLPGAFVRRLEHNVGYGPTLNETLELVTGASFYCLCHDDVVLEPDCVHELVSEAFRSNAGIVGPKMVDWDDPELLLSVGFTIDSSAGRAPYAERHELDQGQHDAVRDVFAVAGGCTLVRADLFGHLGGFDPGIDLVGEDLDLCWRAHLVGARVVVAPSATVRHRERLAERVEVARLTRVDAAHRMRTVFSNLRLRRLIWSIPRLVFISVVEAIVEWSIGRRAHARAQIAAWGTTIRSIPSIARSRRRVRAIRERDDRAIGQLQTRFWARLDGVIQANRRERAIQVDSSGGPPRRRTPAVTWALVALVVVLVAGSRELLFGALPAIGSFAAPPSGLAHMWHLWGSSWNPLGLGSTTAQPAGVGTLATLGTLAGGAFGFLRRLAILLPVPIGLFGAWRVTRPLGSRRAQLVATVLYAAVPLPWNALAQGVWGGLVVYAVAPWILHCSARAMRVVPYAGARNAGATPAGWAMVLGYGLLVAVVATLAPAVVSTVIVVGVGLALGSLVLGRTDGLVRLVTATAGALVVAAVLLSPWTLAGPGRSMWSLAGVGGAVHGWSDLGELLRFQSGPMGAGPVGYVFLVAAALPLVIGRSWRFEWGVRAWGVAVCAWALAWCGQQAWFGVPLPPTEVLLAPAAIAVAVAAACGVVALETDLATFRFGVAQVASLVAVVAVILAVLPLLANATDGRWRMAPVGLDEVLEFITTQRAEAPFRVVWVGDPAVMPVASRPLDDALSVGVSNEGMPRMNELWIAASADGSRPVHDALDLAMASETTRVGRVLADMGVRYVVLPRQTVPLPYRSTAHRPPTRLLDAMEDQLDLARVPVNDAVVVYRNEAWRPGPTLLPATTPVGGVPADVLDAPDGTRVDAAVDPLGTTRFAVPGGGILATGQPADSTWRLTVDGKKAEPVTLWGWEQGFEVADAGRAELARSSPRRPFVMGFTVVAWLLVLGFWIGGRRRPSDDLLADDLGPVADAGSLVRLDPEDPDSAGVTVEQIEVEPVETADVTPGDDKDDEA